MYELVKTDEVNRLIAVTKSNSGISGPELAKAHIRLGELLAEEMNYPPNDTTVVAILRGGMFFAQGIYFRLGCRFQTFDPKHETFNRPDTKYVILVDSVINTGTTLSKIIGQDMAVACCVINEKAISRFVEKLFTVRVSQNSFVGENVQKQVGNVGPDTTMRLFNQI